MLQSYRAVIFDLDGTLRHSQPTFNQTFLEIAASLGLPESNEGRIRSLRWLHYYWAQSPEMLADREALWEQAELFWANHARKKLLAYGCEAYQAEELAPVITRRMADSFKPQDWVPPDVPETLNRMLEAGLRLAVVSNRNQPCQEDLARLGLSEYMEFSLTSGEVSSWKPDTRIFELALQRLEILPLEAMYVGDNYFADVVGSKRAGLQPVLVDPDGLFPEADCPVIATIGELCGYLA